MSYGLKISASIYIYIYIYISVTFGLEISASLYLCICPSCFGPPRAPRDPRWRPWQLYACRLQTRSTRRVSDLDKSVTKLYQGRLTVAARLVEFGVASVSIEIWVLKWRVQSYCL